MPNVISAIISTVAGSQMPPAFGQDGVFGFDPPEIGSDAAR